MDKIYVIYEYWYHDDDLFTHDLFYVSDEKKAQKIANDLKSERSYERVYYKYKTINPYDGE